MLHAAESAANHCVAEVRWALEYGDAHGERLPDAKMPPSPGHLLFQADEPRCDSRNGALASAGSRVGVQVNAATQVKHPLNRRCDGGGEFDDWHLEIVLRFYGARANA